MNSGYAQGTTYHIRYMSPNGKDYGSKIEQIFETVDYSMSTYRENSLITEINKGGQWVEVDSLFLAVLQRSLEIAIETGGDFDPTVGPLTKLWGFTYSAQEENITPETIASVKIKTGYSNIEIDHNKVRIPAGFELDFNAIAPGFTADVVGQFLEDLGIKNYMVEIGGEIRARGRNDKNKLWRIGVDKPTEDIDEDERFEFILELNNAGLATSGNYRKFWIDKKTGTKYAHTINPHTGYPAKNNLLSATIVAPHAIDADAYATVCMVKGLEECKKFLETKGTLEAYLVYTTEENEWGVYLTEGFKSFLIEEFRQRTD